MVNQKQNTHTLHGYTLIEMLVVLSIFALIIPVVFSIIYVLLNQQVKIYRLIETKRQGDRIMSFMKEKILRETEGIRTSTGTPRCSTYTGVPETTANGNDFIFLKDKTATPATFNFYVNGTSLLAQDSTNLTSTSLHDNRIEVSNFQIQCFKRTALSDPSQPYEDVVLLGFSYTVTFVDKSPTAAEGDTSLHYQTKIRLR